MNSTTAYRINAPHIVHEIFDDGEAAIINLKSGSYYSLDPVGAGIWALIEKNWTVGEIVEHLVQRYDGSLVRIIDDVNTLVASLQTEELIVPTVGGDDGSRPTRLDTMPTAKVPYSPPVFERFEDMKELLLLDPIHEVGDAGWPHAKADKS